MNNIKPPVGAVELVKDVIRERKKYKVFYSKIITDLEPRLERYKVFNGDGVALGKFDFSKYVSDSKNVEPRKDSFRNLYSNKSIEKPRDDIVKIRLKNGLNICPACGEMGRPYTVDHYLPKEHFPELSFFLDNLTPMCDCCQGKKGEVYEINGGRAFLHPYYDDLSDPMIYLKINEPYASPVLEFDIDDRYVPLMDVVKSHLDGLDFYGRYIDYFVNEIASIESQAKSANEAGTDLTTHFSIVLTASELKGINSWESILYRSILRNLDYLEYLRSL